MPRNDVSELAVIYRPIDALSPHPNNARTHKQHQIRQIAASIDAFGFTNPILVDSHDTIIAGHGRVAAAKLLGMDRVPTIRLEGLSQDQIRAYVIADNRLAEKAGWDSEILAIEFQHLITIDLDVTITGFDMAEVDLVVEEAKHSGDDDDVFEVDDTKPAVTQSGDLWLLGRHRILCANSLEHSAYKTLLRDRKAQVAFLDPPYNLAIDGNVSGHGSIRRREFKMGSGEMNEAEFVAFLTTTLRLASQHSTPGSIQFICMDWRHIGEVLAAGEKIYDSLLNICVWVKDRGGLGSFYRSRHELILVFRNGKGKHLNNIQLGR
jgi:ParB-like nuclease domain/DNA methylase